MSAKEDGQWCRLPSDLSGRCEAGVCVAGAMRTDPGERCRLVQGVFGPQRECRPRMRFALEPAELDAEAAKIRERIRDAVLYDVEVSLVPLADGGANILVFNRRPRDEVRGLVDPSFVAFEVAGFTEQSDWRSRQLMVWLEPYVDGWKIPTSGGRRAVRRGREASVLGALGVIDITSFRRWLQRTFSRIEAPAPMALGEELSAPGAASDPPSAPSP